MIDNHFSRLTALASALLIVTLSGCTTATETYRGVASDQVWTAMVAAAQDPQHYPDWHVTENEVWANPDEGRIEVYRTIKRDVIIPLGKPQRQDRTMQHQIRLLEDDGEPVVKFVSRHMDIPERAREEAQLYFADVWEILGGKPQYWDGPTDPPSADDEPDDDAGEDEELIDIDDIGG